MNKRLAEIMKRKEEIRTALKGTDQVDMEAMEKEITDLNAEEKELRRRQEIANSITLDEEPEAKEIKKPGEARSRHKGGSRFIGILNSEEYRNAFMLNVTKREPIPQELRTSLMEAAIAEKRADANTLTTDIGALVPPETMNQVITKLEQYGQILNLVTKTNKKTGVNIPVSDFVLVASWVGEGQTSEKQKAATVTVQFGHNKLRCAVSVSLESDVMSLSAFETSLADALGKAFAKALDIAIVSGTGTNQMTGILKDTTKGVTVEASAITYDVMMEAEGELPEEYDNDAVWVMTKKTFMQFKGIKDTNGRPIADTVIGIDGKPERVLLGRKVVCTRTLPTFSSALTAGTVFAFIYNLADYVVNTNYQIAMKMYEDDETDDIIRKSIMICDGKPVRTESLVKVAYKTA